MKYFDGFYFTCHSHLFVASEKKLYMDELLYELSICIVYVYLFFTFFSALILSAQKTLFRRLVRLFRTTQIAQRGSLAASSLLQKFPPPIWLAFCFLSQNFSAETDYFCTSF
jgi:hypothetical protein